MNTEPSPKKVVYLIGAGASHACVLSVGSSQGILMRDLGESLSLRLQDLVRTNYSEDQSLVNFVNTVVNEETDFEHIITFLDDAPSLRHRQFAEESRRAFADVLRERLRSISEDTQGDEFKLYKVLLDMYSIEPFRETLQGIITTNYDEYLEGAIEEIGRFQIDFGIHVEPSSQQDEHLRLLKLHGSFGWRDTWPISREQDNDATLWIPPGIHKAKQAYPFNVIWGLAREMLSCDVLRVIGCRLGANDWDLISLLFTMRHVNAATRPQIEVIDAPEQVERLKKSYPYLEVLSILEIEEIGRHLISEFTGGPSQEFSEFPPEEREDIIRAAGNNRNWFKIWLSAKVESLAIDLGTVSTDLGIVEAFLEA